MTYGIGQFNYKGISSESFGLICSSVKRPILPSMRPRTLNINGVSGVFDFGDNDYNTRQITMHINLISNNIIDLRSTLRNIANWLSSETWEKLIINDETDKYYLARVINGVDLETVKLLGQADITFECQPFAYAVTESSFTTTLAVVTNYSFTNTGNRKISYRSPQGSKFEIVVTGTFTTLTLSMNEKTLNYTEAVASGTLTIDNINMEVNLNGVNKLSVISGDLATFLNLASGVNVLSISGTDLNINVTINFIPMWI